MPPLAFRTEPPPAYGTAEVVHPLIRRVVARNPGPFTYHGTNTWILGRDRVAVIDPGPDDPAHRAAVLAAVEPGRVSHILLTHGHADHAAGAAALAAATGAPVLAMAAGRAAPRIDRPLAEGDVIEAAEWRLLALHTPGHAADHLCFALEAEGVLFSGDHVMPWSTSVVAPPAGDMAAYMRSLARLLDRAEALYLAGHGPPLPDPRPHVAALLAHRQGREAAILAALAGGAGTVAAIVAALYPDLAPALRPAAVQTVRAHLIKLAAEGRLPPGAPVA